MANKNPNIVGIMKYSKEKNYIAKKKVDQAIKKMLKNHTIINFNSVSIEANVSKAFLYKYDDVRNQIETLRNQQKNLPSPKNAKYKMTDNSKDVLITSLKKRIHFLEEKNKDLNDKLKLNYGKIYEKI